MLSTNILAQLKTNDLQANLKPTPFTTVTLRDGSRFIEKKDGVLEKLPCECVDESGQWGIFDERGALGLSRDGNDAKTPSSSTALPVFSPSKELLSFVTEHPELSPSLRLVKMGAPLGTVQMRLTMMDGKISDAVIGKFIGLAMADGLGSSPHESQESQDGPDVGSELQCEHFSELHGHLGDPSWAAPQLAVKCEAEARPGYTSEKGHEYLDSPAVLQAKVKVLATLFRRAKKPVVYAGAGLSTSSGINDYATKTGHASILRQRAENARGTSDIPKPNCEGYVSPFAAKPNLGHHVLAAMAREGYLWRFVQQNHDGLPQKAGMPQYLVNEIHGGWFDPSNPVVSMSGNLRGDLFEDLLNCERETDLVLAVGSSLCGMNADRLVSTSANRSRNDRKRRGHQQRSRDGVRGSSIRMDELPNIDGFTDFGSVIVSVQKTVHDHNSSLRIFGIIDEVMELLAKELDLSLNTDNDIAARQVVPTELKPLGVADDAFLVPYDMSTGERLDWSFPTSSMLDLRQGSELRIASGPDKGARATVLGKNKDGHFRISVERTSKSGGHFNECRLLGAWWPAAAANGEVDRIPLITGF